MLLELQFDSAMIDELECVVKVIARLLTSPEAELVDGRCRGAVRKRERELRALRRGRLGRRRG